MRLLVLGGTGFVGRHAAAHALARGHDVTLFHRGRSNRDILGEAEHVIGDREASLAPLAGRVFDAVIDPSGYEPRHVLAAARALDHPALHYVFVSTISVYADLADRSESGPTQVLADPSVSLAPSTYGPLKAACEAALAAALPGRVVAARAGLILGPHDYDERFRWWLERLARGGEVIGPGDPAAVAQAIDVRDLAAWLVHVAEQRVAGTFNVNGAPLAMRALVETLHATVASTASITWIPDDVLVAHEVAPYRELPFWLPASLGARPVPIDRALAAGLTLRPFADTARDTWAWLRADGWAADAAVRADRPLRAHAGLSADREAAILAAVADRA